MHAFQINRIKGLIWMMCISLVYAAQVQLLNSFVLLGTPFYPTSPGLAKGRFIYV